MKHDVSRGVRDTLHPELVDHVTYIAKEFASVASEKVAETTSTVREAVENYTTDHPWQALAYAALGGTIIGAMLFADRG